MMEKKQNDSDKKVYTNVSNHPPTLTPLTSSSSNEPMSNASAAFTSPRGGISGGVN